jgi:hypothetical protein
VTRWLLTVLLALGCSPNYCPNGAVVFAVDDPRLLPAAESAVKQLAPHLPVPLSAVPTEDVTQRQWRSAEVWQVTTVTDGDPRTTACDPVTDGPDIFVGAETSPIHQAIFVCNADVEAGATRLVLHEIGHVIGGPDHSDDPNDVMAWAPAKRDKYTSNDIALITATCG